VTIAAGFICRDGVLLCADTEESGIGFKRKVAKIEFRPELWPNNANDPIALFTGSGDSAFVDEVIDRMWGAVGSEKERDKIIVLMVRENRKYHREIWEIYPPIYSMEQLPDADLLFAVAAKDGFGLYSMASTRFKVVRTFASIGCGSELAHYICSGAHSVGMTKESCAALAIHMLEQAKANTPGCGGDSHLAILTRTGAAQLLPKPEAQEMGEHLATGERLLKQMLVKSADLKVGDAEFKYSAEAFIRLLVDSRKQLRKSKDKRRRDLERYFKRLVKRGKPGTPTPSVSQA